MKRSLMFCDKCGDKCSRHELGKRRNLISTGIHDGDSKNLGPETYAKKSSQESRTRASNYNYVSTLDSRPFFHDANCLT